VKRDMEVKIVVKGNPEEKLDVIELLKLLGGLAKWSYNTEDSGKISVEITPCVLPGSVFVKEPLHKQYFFIFKLIKFLWV
jgi:hypothetical protein